MTESILITNATIVSSTETIKSDVYISDGTIKQIGKNIVQPAEKVIDASGLFLLPGVLDPQVHFREPGEEWKENLESGSKAAAAGGVTGDFDMANNKPAITTVEQMAEKKRRAAQKSLVNYNFFMGATPDNLDELNNAPNICGIKIFMGSSTGDLLVNRLEDQERIFSQGKCLIAVHAEDEAIIQANTIKFAKSTNGVRSHRKIRSEEAALKATTQAVMLAKKYKRRLHILHLSSEEEVLFLRDNKESPLISVEVTPQHLLLHAPEIYAKLGTFAQMNPPIREKRHADALWSALKQGTIDCIATDHAPHTNKEKSRPFGEAPSGMPGVETSLPLMLNQVHKGLCSLNEVVKWMCEQPVNLYGVKNKGFVKEGFDADLVIVDMKKANVINNARTFAKVRWSAFHGWEIHGWPLITIVNGQIVFREGDFFTDVKGKEIQIQNRGENSD